VFDFAFPGIPQLVRNIASLAQMIHVRDQLEAIERAIRDFVTTRRKRLVGIPGGKPCFGRKQPKKFLKASGDRDEHLGI
jgi:hypothetical protein